MNREILIYHLPPTVWLHTTMNAGNCMFLQQHEMLQTILRKRSNNMKQSCLQNMQRITQASCSWLRQDTKLYHRNQNWYINISETRAGIATRYGLQAGRQGFHSRQEQIIFLFSAASRPAMGFTQPPIQWRTGALSPGVKWPGREADHSHPPSTEVDNGGTIAPLADQCPCGLRHEPSSPAQTLESWVRTPLEA
jgi:hypothetical protein